MVSEVTRFYCQPLNAIFYDGFWKSDHDFLIVFHINFSSGMHGFRVNEVLLQGGYGVIMISPLGGASGDFYDGFWKSDHDFLIVFHINFLSGMHGFRDNEVFLQGWYDVIMISPLGVFHTGFVDGIWKATRNVSMNHDYETGDPSFIIMVYWHISRISYRFGVIRHFILAGNCPFQNYTFLIPKRVFFTPDRVFELLCAKIGSRIWAVALLKIIKKNYKNVTLPVYVAPAWRLDRSSNPNQLCQSWWPP